MSSEGSTVHVPVVQSTTTSTAPVQRHQAAHQSISKGREQKDNVIESGDQLVYQAKRVADDVIQQACHTCSNWRQYPKVLTGLLLITFFLLGAGSMAGCSKLWGSGGRGSYVSSHWDRNTADAHHALDVILDHLHHPDLYDHPQSQGILTKAKNSIMGLFGGKTFSQQRGSYGGSRTGSGGGVAQEVYQRGKDISRAAWERTEDLTEDVGHGLKSGIKDVGEKISGMFGGMKDAVVGSGGSSYEDASQYVKRGTEKLRSASGNRRDEQFFQEEPEDLDVAQQTVRRVLRETERNY